MIVSFILVSIAAKWMLCSKMGYEGWEFLIPIYNTYCTLKRIYKHPVLVMVLIVLLGPIPIIGWILLLAIGIKYSKYVAGLYPDGRSGLVFFFSPIYIPILTFRNAQYNADYMSRLITRLFKMGKESNYEYSQSYAEYSTEDFILPSL